MTSMQEDNAFKTNDIRGIYPKEINEKLAYKVGQAIVRKFKPKEIVIGRDARASSPLLFKSVAEGILSLGCNIIDIGLTNTPFFYYSVGELKADFGIMITASHNPGQFNGFKLVKKDVIPTTVNEIQALKKAVNKKFKESKKKGKVSYKDISEKYVRLMLSKAKVKRGLRVVVDTGNGMSAPMLQRVFSELPINVTFINQKIDMINPKHEANPLKQETLAELQRVVKKSKADLGIAFDGDGDRIGFVDETGRIVQMDIITAFLSTIILKERPGAPILFDLRSSDIVRETIEKHGGRPVEFMVGHSLIKLKMRKINCPFGGEVSGHYYLREFYYSEAPIYISIVIMNQLRNKGLSELVAPFQKYYKTPEINFKVSNPEKKMQELKRKYNSGKIDSTDGLKIRYPDWWFSIRISHTESLLRLNLEAKKQDLMQKKLSEIKKIIESN